MYVAANCTLAYTRVQYAQYTIMSMYMYNHAYTYMYILIPVQSWILCACTERGREKGRGKRPQCMNVYIHVHKILESYSKFLKVEIFVKVLKILEIKNLEVLNFVHRCSDCQCDVYVCVS